MLCWKPWEMFFRVRESIIFFAKVGLHDCLINIGSAKDKHGIRESFAKVTCLFAKNGRSRIKEFWSTTIYIYVCVYVHNVINYIKVYIKWSTHFIVGSSLVTRLTAARCGFGIREFARYNQNAWECFWEWFGLLSDQNFTEVVCYPDTSLQSSFS